MDVGDRCAECEYKATEEDKLAAIVIFLTALTGVIANALIAFTIGRLPLLRNSFGTLLRLQSSAGAVFLVIWSGYFAPALFFDLGFVKMFVIAEKFGRILLICYDISIYTHLVMSINRFVSLYFPTKYSRIFTERTTTAIVITILIGSLAFSFVLPAVNCMMGFSNAKWMLDYQASCDFTVLYYGEFLRAVILVATIFIINLFTLIKMHLHNRRKQQGVTAFETTQQLKRKEAESNFVKQVCLQGSAYALELFTYFLIANYCPSKWPNFLLTTWAWIMVHTTDGLITLLFNKQFRALFFTPESSRSRPSATMGSSKVITPTLPVKSPSEHEVML